MKIAVTGGSGFIGLHLIKKLVSEGNEVLSLDKSVKSNNLTEFQDTVFVECDILDSDKLVKETTGIDCVIHLAGLSSPNKSIHNPHEHNRVNIDGTVNVLEACRINDIKKFVFASSSAVYGNKSSIPQTEDAQVFPSNPYGLSKVAGEKYCSIYSENFGLETVSLRPFNVYGPGQRTTSGVVAAFMEKIVLKQQPVIFGAGDYLRDFTFVEDVAEAFFLSTKNSKKANARTINIGSGKNYSIYDLLQKIEEISETKIEPLKKESLLGDVKQTLPDITLAKELLGWEPKHSLSEGLKITYDWYKKNLTKS